MRILIQRVKEAHVDVDRKVVGKIGKGLLVFFGLHKDDTESSIPWLVNKLVGLRVFEDEQGKMNLNVKDIGGEILVVSQFTLYGNCMNGRRPDFVSTMRGEEAEQMYDRFVKEVQDAMGTAQTGQFGANMQVHLVNDGPVTFMIER